MPVTVLIFLLLVFFMICGKMSRGGGVDLPISSSGKEARPAAIEVAVSGSGIFLAGEKLHEDELGTRLEIIFTANPEQEVLLKAAGGFPAKDMVRFLKLAQKAGGRNISLATSPR